jgi:WD40 repeat protein
MLVLCHNSALRLFDLNTFSSLRPLPNAHCGMSRLDTCFSPDGRYVMAGSDDGVLGLWDADSGAPIPARARAATGQTAVVGYPGPLHGVAWHPSQHLVAVAAFGAALPIMVVGADARLPAY